VVDWKMSVISSQNKCRISLIFSIYISAMVSCDNVGVCLYLLVETFCYEGVKEKCGHLRDEH